MTKEDYIKFADLIGDFPEIPDGFIAGVCFIFENDNPLFSDIRFYEHIENRREANKTKPKKKDYLTI